MKNDINKEAPNDDALKASKNKNMITYFNMIQKLRQEGKESDDFLYNYIVALANKKALEIENFEIRKEVKSLREKIKSLNLEKNMLREAQREIKALKRENKDLKSEINAMLNKEAGQ